MSENTQNNTPKKEQYSLNDDRRVKVLFARRAGCQAVLPQPSGRCGPDDAACHVRLFPSLAAWSAPTARTSSSTPTPRCPKSMWV